MNRILFAIAIDLVGCVPTETAPITPTPPDAASPDASSPTGDGPVGHLYLKSGTGILASYDFGSVAVGGDSVTLALTVTNDTPDPTGGIDPRMIGLNPGDFTVAAGTDCTPRLVLLPGAECNVRLEFHPTTVGPRATSFSVAANPGGETSIDLTGTGAEGPMLRVTPPYRDFAVREFGHPGQQAFTVQNHGTQPLDVTGVAVAQGLGTGFSLVGTDCLGELAPAAICNLTVAFDPHTFGQDSADLVIDTPLGQVTQGANWVMGYGGGRLTVVPGGTGIGVVVSDGGGNPNIDCGSTCSGLFIEAQNHTLTATWSSSEDTFGGWTGVPGCGSDPTCVVDVSTTPIVVGATFDVIP